MSIEVHPVSTVIGAEIRGVDLAEPLTPEDKKVIEEALLDHLVVFFRDQQLDDGQHRAFAAQFGSIEPFVLAPPANADVPEMHTLTFDDGAGARGSKTDSWHTDGIFMETPPLGTILRAVELPPYGGDTCWANMYAVYESLSPAMQRALDGLEAEHDYMKISYTTFDDFPDPEAELKKLFGKRKDKERKQEQDGEQETRLRCRCRQHGIVTNDLQRAEHQEPQTHGSPFVRRRRIVMPASPALGRGTERRPSPPGLRSVHRDACASEEGGESHALRHRAELRREVGRREP